MFHVISDVDEHLAVAKKILGLRPYSGGRVPFYGPQIEGEAREARVAFFLGNPIRLKHIFVRQEGIILLNENAWYDSHHPCIPSEKEIA